MDSSVSVEVHARSLDILVHLKEEQAKNIVLGLAKSDPAILCELVDGTGGKVLSDSGKNTLNSAVTNLVSIGKKVVAVRLVRDVTGLSLAESKEYVTSRCGHE